MKKKFSTDLGIYEILQEYYMLWIMSISFWEKANLCDNVSEFTY